MGFFSISAKWTELTVSNHLRIYTSIFLNLFISAICQLRLDFDVVRIATPNIDGDVASVTGTCTSDTIAATSPSGKSPPSYCGDISGTHSK